LLLSTVCAVDNGYPVLSTMVLLTMVLSAVVVVNILNVLAS
jgi:hypothetical protein